jgi:hypothetical protein
MPRPVFATITHFTYREDFRLNRGCNILRGNIISGNIAFLPIDNPMGMYVSLKMENGAELHGAVARGFMHW